MPHNLADGTGVPNSRAQSACIRAIDSYRDVIRSAERLTAEIDRQAGSGVIRLPLEDT
jgi:hypothetical protein